MKTLTKLSCILLSLPALVWANPLVLENSSLLPLYAHLGNSYIKYIPGHSVATISEGQFNSACELTPHDCTMLILKSPLNTGNDIAKILLDVESGIVSLEQPQASDFRVDGNGFHLWITRVV